MDFQKGEETNSKTDPVLGEIELGSEEEKSKESSKVNTKKECERSYMTFLWHSNSFLLGEGRFDIELGAIAKLDKECVLFLSSLFLGSIFTLAASNPIPVQAGPVDSGHVLVR